MKTVPLFGYTISSEDAEANAALALGWVESGISGRYMATANPHSLVVASGDGLFRNALQQADMLTPDGVGVVLAAHLLDLPLPRRVVGYDFFIALTRALAAKGEGRVFFLGSSDRVLSLIVKRLNREFPSLCVCGTYAPTYDAAFSDEENGAIVEAINAARPDVLWVGMTAPKQEKWLFAHRDRLQVPFAGAVGAAFDFYAGTSTRAPAFIQGMGLEWLYRFICEPRRLWKRNLVSTPRFIGMVLREKMRLLRAESGDCYAVTPPVIPEGHVPDPE